MYELLHISKDLKIITDYFIIEKEWFKANTLQNCGEKSCQSYL